ncbi:hypothetical protein HY771_02955 [Candidatus Uhrbacteria bacterium]|nr:hypothetical protein [Candidatus Uhrbacteria bacterium]MBI4812477.1 hypothetical protein [Candidatus Falkowbacteria bacterium]
MNNLNHLLKVTVAWTTIAYVVCFAVVAFYPPIRELFFQYALHTKIALESIEMGVGNFISGLIIWNILDVVFVWLFAALYKAIK